MDNSEIRKIADALNSNPSVVKNWRRIYDELDLCPAEGDDLSEKKITGLITKYELFSKILRSWKSKSATKATAHRLERILRNLGYEEAAAQLLKLPLRYNCLAVNTNFVSRPYLEKEIMAALPNVGNSTHQIDFPLVVLYGERGVGKTLLARKICLLSKYLFEGNCICINAESEEKIIQDFADIFGITEDISTYNIHETLKKCYASQLKYFECLLIFDNVKDFKTVLCYLPLDITGTKVSVIIISKVLWDLDFCKEVCQIRVNSFTKEEFCTFVKILLPRAKTEEIKALEIFTRKIPYLVNLVCLEWKKWKYQQNGIEEFFKINHNKLSNGGKNDIGFIIDNNSPTEIVDRQIDLTLKYEEDSTCLLLCVLAYSKLDISKSYLSCMPIYHKGLRKLDSYLQLSEIKTLINLGFLTHRKDENVFYDELYCHHQSRIQNFLRHNNKEEEQIQQIIESNLNEHLTSYLNYSLLWELGNKFGDKMLESMIQSEHFLPELVENQMDDAIKELVRYAKRSKSKEDYARWVLFETTSWGSWFFLAHKMKYADLFIENFEDLIVEMKSHTWAGLYEDRKKILDFAILIAFKKKEWLTLVFASYPELVKAKIRNFKGLRGSFINFAVYYREVSAVECFIETGIDVNEKNKKGHTILHQVASSGNCPTFTHPNIKLMIYTPLKMTPQCPGKYIQIMKLILNAGADPNVQGLDGFTPLHFAKLYNNSEGAELLISHGADPNIKNNDGKSPLEM